MIVHYLHKVHELLVVLAEPTAEMKALPGSLPAQTLTSVSQGQGIRATALSQGMNKGTVLAWWLRLGERAGPSAGGGSATG